MICVAPRHREIKKGSRDLGSPRTSLAYGAARATLTSTLSDSGT